MATLVDRKLLYGVLAVLFHYPDPQTLETVAGLDVELLREILPGVPALPLLPDQENVEPLQPAYTALFINRQGGVPAPPYGSVYLDGESQVMGRSTRQVEQAYAKVGFSSAESKQPADFLPTELEFMYRLLEQQEQGRDEASRLAAVRQQQVFFSELLGPWLGAFCRRIEEASDVDPFYAWSASVLRLFSAQEKERYG